MMSVYTFSLLNKYEFTFNFFFSVDQFSVDFKKDLGDIVTLSIGHDNSGIWGRAWKPAKVLLHSSSREIPCSRVGGKSQNVVPVTLNTKECSFPKRFARNILLNKV